MEITAAYVGRLRASSIEARRVLDAAEWNLHYAATTGASQRERAKLSAALLRAGLDSAYFERALRDAEAQFADDAGEAWPAPPTTPRYPIGGPR